MKKEEKEEKDRIFYLVLLHFKLYFTRSSSLGVLLLNAFKPFLMHYEAILIVYYLVLIALEASK